MKKLIRERSKLALRNSCALTLSSPRTSTSASLCTSNLASLHTSTLAPLHPWFITGFTDAEGCFFISIYKNKLQKTGVTVKATFQICLHEKDRSLLEMIQLSLGVGQITKCGKSTVQYRVTSPKDLRVIIDHFDKYSLITQKRADFELFKSIVDLMNRKEHLNLNGLQEIVNIRASINNGLSDMLTAAFPKTKPVQRPVVEFKGIQDPNWLAGFVSGEGCFLISIFKANTNTGFAVKLTFSTSQHARDVELMESMVGYLDCGRYTVPSGYNHGEFIVTKISDISGKILPFFNKYPVEGVKGKDFADFCNVCEMMKSKIHLTQEGLEKIRKIKSGMNKGRII